MLIKKINLKDVFPRKMPGRNIFDLVTKDTLESGKLSMEMTVIEPGQEVKPCHSHKAEEVAYVISGKGKVWVDGMMADLSKGDAILWPSGSKHCLKNIGEKKLILLCAFSDPSYQTDYEYYEEITPFSVK
jgi:quercetin dioxygenase-like cupin family protein